MHPYLVGVPQITKQWRFTASFPSWPTLTLTVWMSSSRSSPIIWDTDFKTSSLYLQYWISQASRSKLMNIAITPSTHTASLPLVVLYCNVTCKLFDSIFSYCIPIHLSGALIYLLDLYCSATNADIREQTAELFSKILSDKLIGPKVRIMLAKFLPPIFMDAMRDSAEASVHMFEGTSVSRQLQSISIHW